MGKTFAQFPNHNAECNVITLHLFYWHKSKDASYLIKNLKSMYAPEDVHQHVNISIIYVKDKNIHIQHVYSSTHVTRI